MGWTICQDMLVIDGFVIFILRLISFRLHNDCFGSVCLGSDPDTIHPLCKCEDEIKHESTVHEKRTDSLFSCIHLLFLKSFDASRSKVTGSVWVCGYTIA